MTTTTDTNDIEALEKTLLDELGAAKDLAALENFRVGALGKKGRISALMKALGKMEPEARKTFGQSVNGLKQRVSDALDARKGALEDAALATRLQSETADVTLPVRPGPELMGRIHPISQVWDELTEIFADMGFSVAEGPDIETEEKNFDKLNIPASHPARQEMDTFYLRGTVDVPNGRNSARKVLRTHTSPVQIRTMESQEPPIRIIAPGRVYRSDSDQTHTPMFHQVEGLVIDDSTHMGHLKWCLEEFCKAFFEVDNVRMKFRASHFPFTEPSMEVDIQYAKVGDEVRIGEGDQWMEILGCGMVHPNVLRNVGYDPDKVQGWAFGVGIDRIAMLKYGMPDLRAFFASDLRWLKHYGFLPFDVPSLAGGLSS